MKLTLVLCTSLLLIHSSSGAFFSWGGGSGGGPPTTAAPGPCGIGSVVVDGQQNTTTMPPSAVLTSASCVDGMNAGFVRIEGGIVDLPKGGFVRRRRFTYPGQLTPGLAYTEKPLGTEQPGRPPSGDRTGLAKSDGKLNSICYPELPLASGSITDQLFVSGWGALKEDATLRGKLQLKPGGEGGVHGCTEMTMSSVLPSRRRTGESVRATMADQCYGERRLRWIAADWHHLPRQRHLLKASPMLYTEVYPYLEWI
ncbi:hypothetical protein TYRP_012171 [Tyrophagus putrescentiae]|nr:hypothetical protein TYRP_012171 [Tyrophagus putrescentiae]